MKGAALASRVGPGWDTQQTREEWSQDNAVGRTFQRTQGGAFGRERWAGPRRWQAELPALFCGGHATIIQAKKCLSLSWEPFQQQRMRTLPRKLGQD